ncbi:hypothetical protein [Streptomyces goshikiensis]|uniref:hypothetical protein n=1 Tax=Streptomyces goshikiensis TaxID=1942 RepID=UPI00368262E5
MRRMHAFAEQLAELVGHQEDRWKVQSTNGQIFLTVHSDPSEGPDGIDTVTAGRSLDTSSLKSQPADW